MNDDVLALAGALAKCEAIFRLQEPKKRMRTKRCLAMPETTRFYCPNCAAEYMLVRAEAGPPPDHQIECRRCGAPLHGREGRFILKYFLIGRGRTQAKAARAG
jgi:hypothetical protein